MLQQRQPSLKEVQQQFERWRSHRKNHRSQIPTALWEGAALLSEQYSVHELSKRLHLNHTALRDRVAEYKQGNASKPQGPTFIELDMLSARATVVSECIIEMEKADAKMKITFKGTYPAIAEISKAFLG